MGQNEVLEETQRRAEVLVLVMGGVDRWTFTACIHDDSGALFTCRIEMKARFPLLKSGLKCCMMHDADKPSGGFNAL